MLKILPLSGVSRGVLLVLLAWMIWAVDPILIRVIGQVSSLVLGAGSLSGRSDRSAAGLKLSEYSVSLGYTGSFL